MRGFLPGDDLVEFCTSVQEWRAGSARAEFNVIFNGEVIALEVGTGRALTSSHRRMPAAGRGVSVRLGDRQLPSTLAENVRYRRRRRISVAGQRLTSSLLIVGIFRLPKFNICWGASVDNLNCLNFSDVHEHVEQLCCRRNLTSLS
jgi:hypothetical protein